MVDSRCGCESQTECALSSGFREALIKRAKDIALVSTKSDRVNQISERMLEA